MICIKTKYEPIKMFIPVRKKGSWDQWLPDEAILVFATILQYSYGFYPINMVMTPTMIAMALFHIDKKPTTEQIKYVKTGLNALYKENTDWLKPIKDNESYWGINTKSIREINKDTYVCTYLSYRDIQIAGHVVNRYINENMAFYIRLMSTFDTKYGVGHYTKDQLSTFMDIDVGTVKDRIERFVKKEIIKVYHPPVVNDKDKYWRDANIYYLPGEIYKAERYSKETRKFKISNTKGD